MKEKPWLLKHIIPLTAYVFVILTIFIAKFFVPWTYVISIAAVLMLLIPIVLKSEGGDLRWDFKGVLLGLGASIVLLSVYIAVIALYGHYIGKSLVVHNLSYSFILMQLLLVALPEEVFFRGYLQSKIGNNIKGIIIVSLLFAVGHFITLCLGGGHNLAICSQAILTFFPSLVMGYLYLASKTLWASIIFHFFANVVHIAIGLS
ncbi:MAG: CPBP family intramembrane metalloprotease [Candidatus Dadabacteria bacterium]|nr:CPBP family intramembrane metalloprotease [Candidatus Dadabacteria bacterium]